MGIGRSSARRGRRGRPSRTLGFSRRPVKRARRHAPAHAQFQNGYANGYREGVQFGLQGYDTLFEGTSIIIPTYNQLELLKQCLGSIMDNTDRPYEMIVVDNASTDGTADYLRKLGGTVRYRVLDQNRGFAGAINAGLMMAKGQTLLLLNTDTLVTENWLDNLLVCLHSDERIGMVGPVTNYSSGDQQIKVPYSDIGEMPAFAKSFNVSNAALWHRTDRLVGFCLLFRRELFQQVGYFDERFVFGSFEDDDYNIRVRLLGKSLVVAADTFIHHFGSPSIKALGDRFISINEQNERYFLDKWHLWNEWIHQTHLYLSRSPEGLKGMVSLFPSRIAVQGIGAGVYWIDRGERRPVEGVLSFQAVRVSQTDLKQWPLGEPITAAEAERLWLGGERDSADVVALPDGTLYHLEDGRARRIVGPAAMEGWNLHQKKRTVLQAEKLAEWEPGLPIVAPPLLRQVL
ncbi:glycosyltransferase family 2 protein [Cohnella nanjingensis]|uniref:Glycosyltransferase family 2 protein n=1 Tax=Cohnella nanjingensis TaxID=1387779 RepID=A0A7X0VJ40_9BACL|nr:glycosyltransferase family 2 protein [Cohnella nanjingensis]MBB6675596.1 glycosyltransferase family 2 protein [Cohnella nanjingensis]